MVSLPSKTDIGFIKGYIQGGSGYTTRTRTISKQDRSTPTSGSVITVPGGQTFRKATDYHKFHRWLEAGSPQRTVSTVPGKVYNVLSNPGGYRGDFTIASGAPSFVGGTGVMEGLNINQAPGIPQSMRNEANTKALLKIVNAKANIGENLATFRQTLNLVKDPLTTLVRQMNKIGRDRRFKRFLRRSKEDLDNLQIDSIIAREYLKYVYGWKPLMSDIYGIMSLLREEGQKSLLLSGVGSSSRTGEIKSYTRNQTSFNAVDHIGPLQERAKVRTKLWSRIDPNCPGLLTLNQLGLLNPLSLAWELVPYSFVVDWVVPIGPVLSALTAPAGLLFVDGSISVRNSITGPYDHHWTVADPWASQNQFADGTVRYEGYRREHLTAWPLPGIWTDPTPFSGDRALKALALAIVRLRDTR